MVLYAPYEARYKAAFVLRDHLNAAARKTSPSGMAPFFANLGLYDTDIEASVRGGFQIVLERYSNGNVISEVLSNDGDAEMLPPQVQEAFVHDENSILYKRSVKRQDIFCKTDAARLIATREAWRDIDALAKVFKSGLKKITQDYVDAFSNIEKKIKTELAQAERAAKTVVELSSSRDYEIAPNI